MKIKGKKKQKESKRKEGENIRKLIICKKETNLWRPTLKVITVLNG